MATAQQERAERNAAKAKRSQRYKYDPVFFDVLNGPRDLRQGQIVVKIQPHGCPRNGTMGMTYVGDPDTGAFIGMVMLNSLKKVVR